MYSNNKTILQLLSLLKAFNINKVVISSGTRHFPLIHSLESDNYFKLYSVVDERSAAFFALGLIQHHNEPVAICCTSGSAVLNYGSAVSESFYQHLPLLLITVDRFPELLGQKEDQMLRQDNPFHEFIKYHANLPDIKNNMDEWYVNRVINEALIELNHHGKGPVQINFPILEHNIDPYNIESLPKVRKVTLHTSDMDADEWLAHSRKLIDKKILIVWGQSVPFNNDLQDNLTNFCNTYNCVILTDKISNLHHPNAIENAFVLLRSMTLEEEKELFPDIVITVGANIVFNGEIKSYLKRNASEFENWQVGPEKNICDPFHCLNEIFEMNESFFFEKISRTDIEKTDQNYYHRWQNIATLIEEPDVEYSQLFAIGRLIKSIPPKSILHLANSNTIRMGHLFEIEKSIKCFCNRGVNGIDGCMSAAVGYASATDQLVFLIIGDLAFFYDMNSLWNKHLSKNLRILLINNEGGAVIHMAFNQEMGKTLPPHASAGHKTSARGWVESLGITYYQANNETELEKGISVLTDASIEGPILLEVFTQKESDVQILKQYFTDINRITLKDRAVRKAGQLMKKFLKN